MRAAGQGAVYEKGWHFALPYPFEQVIQVPVVPQTLRVRDAFWYSGDDAAATGETAAERAGRAGPLDPLKDGSLLTGDANIVHARYDVSWRIADVVAFIKNIGVGEELDADVIARASGIVRTAVEHGAVHAAATVEADDLIGGRAGQDRARRRAQAVLDELNTGIEIIAFSVPQTAMPLRVFDAYRAVTNAESERAKLIEDARQEYARTLGEAAGEGYQPLLDLIDRYELAAAAGDDAELQKLNEQLDAAYRDLSVGQNEEQRAVGGQVAQTINEAKTYRTQVKQSLESEAQTFEQLLKQYQDPAVRPILLNRLWQEAREEVFTSEGIEKIYSPTGDLWIESGGDPQIARDREQRRLREANEAARN